MKKCFSFNGPPPHFWPISRSRPSDPHAPAPSPRPSPRPHAVFLLPHARRRVRPRQACRAAWRAHAGDAGRVASRGPREHAPRPFSSPSSSASPSIPHFSSPALHLSLAPHRALLAPPSPPQLRRRNWPSVVHRRPQSCAHHSASLSDTRCSL